MKKILVPVDFSETSILAIEVAVKIANQLKSNIQLMHVRTGKPYHPEFARENVELLMTDAAITNMERLVAKNIEIYSVQNGVFDYRIREGNVVREIRNQAHYNDSDLIVAGTHGMSGFEDRWLGSNAYRLISNAPCPVLAVRQNMEFHDTQKILLPIGLDEVSRRIVPQVVSFAQSISAKVLVVGTTSKSRWLIPGRINAYVHQVEKFMKKFPDIDVEFCTKDGTNDPMELLELAHKKEVTLIALAVKRGANPFESIFSPFANELLNVSDLPIFAVPERE
ncbi:MAG TPA: universal stress protein [Marinilabiliaceae bacterium]|nr:universal stress protein [Marinilabiliaceae bacterium]